MTVSGAVGVAFALLAVGVVAALPLPPSFPKPHASVATVVTTFAVLFVMGLAAGVLPARLAARVDPSSAMRAL